jgi:signal transduction histidine kinase
MSFSPLTSTVGEPDGLVCVAQDLTERKALESRLRQADKLAAIGRMVAGVAHEINNPLAVILGFAEGMEDGIGPGDRLHLPVTSIAREALRCQELVQDLLTFSRTAPPATEPIDLNALVRSTGLLAEPRARAQGVELVFDLDDEVGLVSGNRTQLVQVLVNLTTNSMDAMAMGGTLRFRSFHADGAVCLDVEDTGVGIPDEIRSRVLEPFFTTKEVGKGTGLGLSLVYEILQNHGGSIQICGDAGRGTTMSVSLPRNMPTKEMS